MYWASVIRGFLWFVLLFVIGWKFNFSFLDIDMDEDSLLFLSVQIIGDLLCFFVLMII